MDGNRAVQLLARFLESPGDRLHVHFTGGEPLIEWDTLVHIVDELRLRAVNTKADVFFSLQTNGALLDMKKLAKLEVMDVQMGISMDGAAEVDQVHRGVLPGRKSQGVSILEKIPRRLRPQVGVTLVSTPQTITRLPDSIHFLVWQGFRWLVPKINFFDHWDEDDRLHAEIAWSKVGAWYGDEVLRPDAPVIRPILDRASSLLSGRPDRGCGAGTVLWALAPNGKMYACSLWWALDRRGLCHEQSGFEGDLACVAPNHCGVLRCGARCAAYAALGKGKRALLCWFEQVLTAASRPVAEVASRRADSPVLAALRHATGSFARCYWV